MRKSLIACSVVSVAGVGIAVGVVFAQPLQPQAVIQLPPFFAQREAQAPVAIRGQLTALRAQVAASGRNFNLGYTGVLDFPLSQITGAVVPKDLAVRAPQQNIIGNQLRSIDIEARDVAAQTKVLPELKLKPSPNLKKFDWRSAGKITSIRSQSPCGTCWDFAPIAALESSYLLRNNLTIDASEEQILNCAVGNDGNDAGKCDFPPGGWHTPVLEYLVSQGTAKESDWAWSGDEKACDTGLAKPYRAVAWGYVTTDTAPGFTDLRIPSRPEMKQAIVDNGALAVTIDATPAFQAYAGGVDAFKENVPANQLTPNAGGGKKYHFVNHVIDIIGWDDAKNAWLIKNSWGTTWGDPCGLGTQRGYAWVDYDTNNIGFAATWVRAKNNAYSLPPKYFQLQPNIRPFLGDPEPMLRPNLNLPGIPGVRVQPQMRVQ